MSDNKRTFWASVPGVVTGIAGLLTGIVGLVTVLIQLDVIGGGDSDSSKNTPVTTAAAGGGTGTGGSPGATPTTEAGSITVDSTMLDFQPTDPKEKTVTVKNTSNTAAVTVAQPRVTGDDAARFTPSFGTCSSAPLAPNLSCTIKVTFSPSSALRRYTAVMQIQAAGAPRGAEVRLSGTTLLG